jgi:TRAP-type uncharacterized transport system fused permease subunit
VSPAAQAAIGLAAFCVVAVLLAGAVDRFGAGRTSVVVFGLAVAALVLEATTRSESLALAGGVLVLSALALVWVLETIGWRGRRR